MDKYIVWGTGERAKINYIFFTKVNKDALIIAFIDNNPSKQGTLFCGKKVISPNEINNLEWDFIDIWTEKYVDEIQNQIINELFIETYCIRDAFHTIRNKLIEKYSHNQDPDIKAFINHFKSKKWVSIYNFQSKCKYDMSKAYYDDEKNLYFTYFEGNKLYLARNYSMTNVNEEKYVGSFWGEQDLYSPHRYMDDTVYVKDGDVLVDAGTCEGNFALHNIEKVSKAYLVECSPEWVEALKCTFEPWKDKVVICPKYLDEYDSDTTICLDTLVEDKVNYIKMDIEGAERKALLGGKRILNRSNNVCCSICSYHRHGDEEYIKNFLSDIGYKTYSSEGYMWFLLDEYAANNLELRRGIVRAIKE